MNDNSFDIVVRNEGTIWVFLNASEKGRAWILRHLDSQYVERRFADDIIEGAWADGLTIGGVVDGRVGKLQRREPVTSEPVNREA